MARMKPLILVLAIGLGSLGAGQRVRPLSLAELTRDSDLIVVAKLAGSAQAGEADGMIVVRSDFLVERTIKGIWDIQTPLRVKTFKPVDARFSPGEIPLPEKGGRAVLFLKKDETGAYLPSNGAQGVWPLEPGSDTPLGMGLGKTLKEVEEAAGPPPAADDEAMVPLARGAIIRVEDKIALEIRRLLVPFAASLHFAGPKYPDDRATLRVVFECFEAEFLELEMMWDGAAGQVDVSDVTVISHGRDRERLARILQAFR